MRKRLRPNMSTQKSSILFVCMTLLLPALICLFSSNSNATDLQDRFQRIANALESYALDNDGAYPVPVAGRLPSVISTPIAYLNKHETIDPIPFKDNINTTRLRPFRYHTYDINTYPHLQSYYDFYGAWRIESMPIINSDLTGIDIRIYDPTNGTYSLGVVTRSQKITSERGLLAE